jgi:hypothetical protein
MRAMRTGLAAIAAMSCAGSPALARDDNTGWGSPPIVRIMQQMESECGRKGLHLRTPPDTVFGVEDVDGRGRTGFLIIAGVASCATSADLGDEAANERPVMCRADGACRQWLVVGDGARARLAWTGFSPTLSGVNDLRLYSRACESDNMRCPRVYWNGRALTRTRPRRRR